MRKDTETVKEHEVNCSHAPLPLSKHVPEVEVVEMSKMRKDIKS